MSHDVAVMRDGGFVEYGTRRQVFENPTQDYTKALMRAVPVPIPRPEATDLRPVLQQI
jgi:peptide/nickel transport system ATP-binding protein